MSFAVYFTVYLKLFQSPQFSFNFASVLSASRQDLAICTKFQFTTVFLLMHGFSTNLFHLPQNVHDFFSLFRILSQELYYSQFYQSCTVLLLQYDSVFITNFSTCSVSCVSQRFEVRTGSPPRTSQGRSGPTSLNLSVFIFWGFNSLICYGDLHCFNSFIICNWLAISSGYISSVN